MWTMTEYEEMIERRSSDRISLWCQSFVRENSIGSSRTKPSFAQRNAHAEEWGRKPILFFWGFSLISRALRKYVAGAKWVNHFIFAPTVLHFFLYYSTQHKNILVLALFPILSHCQRFILCFRRSLQRLHCLPADDQESSHLQIWPHKILLHLH